MNFKPMLSADVSDYDLSKLNFPLMVSPKLDGVRCIVWEGIAYSRNAKPIRNRFVQDWAKHRHNLDGELIVGSPTDGNVLGRTQSGVMSYEGEPDFSYHLFDCIEGPNDHPGDRAGFTTRLDFVQGEMDGDERIECVPHFQVVDAASFKHHEAQFLADGYEGMMLRHPDGPYKHGRSTVREGWLMKLKRFQDGEAVVVSLEEGSVNTNALERDELGRAKRSKVKGGLAPSGMVGTLICKSPQWGTLRVAPGVMTHAERVAHWRNGGASLIGQTIHWRSFGYGVKDLPRFPRFYGVRGDV